MKSWHKNWSKPQPQAMLQKQLGDLQATFDKLKVEDALWGPELEPPPPGAAWRVRTAVELESLEALLQALMALPADFTVNSRLQRILLWRSQFSEPTERNVDFGDCREPGVGLDFGRWHTHPTIGQDVERGTFSHRHAVLVDANTGKPYTPLHHILQAEAAFEIHNSPLSENAAIGFEYGYNIQTPERLVIWEAQYGDFINGAQSVIDEFVVWLWRSGSKPLRWCCCCPTAMKGKGRITRQDAWSDSCKWQRKPICVLPTAPRPPKFPLAAAASGTPLETDPLPLVVMTPKSLLRHAQAMSSLQELAEGHWQPVIDDPLLAGDDAEPDQVQRLILCSAGLH